MSRRVRNWCDICRDLEPDIKCTNDGCAKKYHEACLRNIGLWAAGDEKRDAYICPDCRESSTNDSFCYICKKELIVAPATEKRRRQSKRATQQQTPSRDEDDKQSPAKEEEQDNDEQEENREMSASSLQQPRRSARQAAARTNAAAGQSSSSGDDNETDQGADPSRRLKKIDASDNHDFVLCDGCVNSAHLRCLGVSSLEGDASDLWFCTECDPHSLTATSMAKSAADRRAEALKQSSTNAATKTRLGNVDICYVCQKGGKLLGCDFCEQSFHPRCIDMEFLEFERAPLSPDDESAAPNVAPPGSEGPPAEKWRCPICKGEDPLKNMAHKRMSRTAMMKLSREWQSCIKQTHRSCKQNRDRFLWSCRKALIPFISQKTLNKLRKSVGAAEDPPEKRQRRRQRVADSEDDLASDQQRSRDREEKEAIKAFKEADRIAKQSEVAILKEGVCLKGYQIIGVGWLLEAFKHKAGAILADEMGLGKTIQCLAFLSALKSMGITGPHLIVVPLSTVGNWAREIRRFIPHLRFVKICGSRFERDHIVADPTASQGLYDLYITTYETVVTEESFFCDTISWQCLILDEAHRIKNESGRIRHSLDRVSANMRTLLTGTPLQNNVKELFTLLNFLFPDILKDSATFEQLFTRQEATPELGQVVDESAIQAVSSLLSKMMLRRTKDLVVKLPRKIEHDVWLPLSPVSAFWYSKLLQVSETETAFQQLSVKKLLGTVVKMRICCCHPRGLITRDVQLKKFKEVFQGLGPIEEQLIEQSANELLSLSGEAHIEASSKLMALDKLLCHLHVQNLEVSEHYKADFVQNCKDLYIQAHPLEPILPQKLSKAGSRSIASTRVSTPSMSLSMEFGGSEPLIPSTRKATPATLSEPTSEMPNTENALSQEIGAITSNVKTEAAPSTEQAKAPAGETGTEMAKPLTSRQQAERLRRERAAAIAAQQAKLDEELLALEESVVSRIRSSAEDINLFKPFMADAKISDNNALLSGAINKGDTGSKVDDGDNTAPESSASGADTEDEGQHSPIIDVTGSAPFCRSGSPDILTAPEGPPPIPTAENAALYPHKVLVFTQFQLVLDELETYCKHRGFRYLRLDGSTNKMIRELDIREFNSTSSTHLVYLICTRAGGVGINLVTANHVILYDEDWNPFIDLQAIDRAHRIGQKRDVHVWKLITEWTVEERMAFRRRQKLKLDRLLIHANTANSGIQETSHTHGEEDDLGESGDRFSVDEIRKLITHGKTAIQKACSYDNSLLNESLESMLQRARQPLPVSIAESEDQEDLDTDGDDAPGPRVSLAEALDPEERAECLVGTTNVDTVVSRTSTDEPDGEIEGEAELMEDVDTAEEQSKRSRRLRKRVPLMFQSLPQVEQKVKHERKLVHDKKCFKCGNGVNPSDEQADPLVPCHRCPKVYHKQGCLSMLEMPRRTWTCPWHECCLCFRKGSQAGGLLIHCAECPTAFCFDCFPPEYKRYTPPATYYSDLSRRGYPVNPEKLVLFLCSRCKALKEQQRRRALTKQQLDAELKKRREANLKAKQDAQKTAETATNKGLSLGDKRTADAKREFLAKKRVIDDSEREWSRDIRKYYENLFPEEFLKILHIKRQKQSEDKQTSATTGDTAAQENAPKATGKVLLAKLPSEFCKVCENCHLPGHEAQSCPFPAETEKRNISQNAALVSSTQTASQNGPQLGEEEQVAERIRHNSKRLIRSFCPKCGVSSRNHFRRHCEQLDAEETNEYNDRKQKIFKFIDALKFAEPIHVPTGMTISVTNIESCRRVLQRRVDDIVAACLTAAGLGNCVTHSSSGFHSTKYGLNLKNISAKNRRRRRSDQDVDELDLSGVETDDPNYSPRKKSKLDQGFTDGATDGDDNRDPCLAAGNGRSDGISEDRRRRRPIPNFIELAGGGTSGSVNDEADEDRVSEVLGSGSKMSPETTAALVSDVKSNKEKRPLQTIAPGEGRDARRKQPRIGSSGAPDSGSRRNLETAESAGNFSHPSAMFDRQPISSSMRSSLVHENQPMRVPSVEANGTRLPPSRWHGHPGGQSMAHGRLPQPLFNPPPAMWVPPFARFPPPGVMLPPLKWQWSPVGHPLSGYPHFTYPPPPGSHMMPK
eukprot:Gregarina_sp_Poly_1__838@NODE_11_length_23386_cov_122_075861_g9_i0_p1_GENE_NODE_11_length_23386_cov_122_075861_g9_i0NODE_11_length_23386_cov_122_075861_g9_i0_p1_ORF_typecomplete_len2103_score346_41SNF2_N/PF00176_23/2_7e68Helicase_C/PF00271_31/2_6e17PHD/PF00628_29/0_074PHD/PF00628_29/4_7e07PHD/PF00628_29/3e05PHD/PF00628_29/0_21PHD/PF00628_29/0_036PHD/PF00628_29/9_3e03PHD/PF00628_29/1_8e04ResIII/PF04851_15/5_6e14ResIII/PF04851_15/7_8e03ERCC3_RAD25_C/PF16203_5/0_00011PHD_2/PF13831_6/7_1e03PHD_2/PF1